MKSHVNHVINTQFYPGFQLQNQNNLDLIHYVIELNAECAIKTNYNLSIDQFQMSRPTNEGNGASDAN